MVIGNYKSRRSFKKKYQSYFGFSTKETSSQLKTKKQEDAWKEGCDK